MPWGVANFLPPPVSFLTLAFQGIFTSMPPGRLDRLDSAPARVLTSRECSRVIGGVLGALLTMSSAEDLGIALDWWREHLPDLVAMNAAFRAMASSISNEV